MHTETAQIATDANAIKLGLWIIGSLLTFIVALLSIASKLYFNAQKAKQLAQIQFNKGITDAVNGLRSDIKEYTVEIKSDIKELVKRVEAHDVKLAEHSEKIINLQKRK